MHDSDAPRELPAVLLIDDDLVSREVMATVLTMSGYLVYTAADGAAALELLAAGECVPGVILMDAQMPGLSGAALIAQLRTRSRAGIFAISASQPPDEVTAAGFLLKPFSPAGLRTLLEERQARENPATAPAEPEEPVLDARTLAQLREVMSEAKVQEIYAAVVDDLGKRIAALVTAMAHRDAAEVRHIGHSIKGGCAMAGARQAARLGALLEAGDNYLDNTAQLLDDLRAARTNLERMLKAEFPA